MSADTIRFNIKYGRDGACHQLGVIHLTSAIPEIRDQKESDHAGNRHPYASLQHDIDLPFCEERGQTLDCHFVVQNQHGTHGDAGK